MSKKYPFLFVLWLLFSTWISACQEASGLNLVSSSRAGVAYGVFADAGYAYITNNEGVVIFDVHDPGRPREVSMILSGYTISVSVGNDLAYIAGERGLSIADVSNPAHPQLLADYDTNGPAQHASQAGDFVYIAGSEGLEIVNISDPSKPEKTAHLIGGEAWGIDYFEGIVYLAVPGSGVEVIDVNDPFSPQKIGVVAGTLNAWDIQIHKELAYVGCHASGIRILNLAKKESPQVIGRYLDDDGGEALGVWGDGEYLYVADNFSVEVLDISEPTKPQEIGEYGGLNGAHDIHVDNMYIYVAEGRKGLVTLELVGNEGR